MVEFDPLLIGTLVGVMGILLWIVTNWHLVRTGRAIKADIDEKRAGTEDFVRAELDVLKNDLEIGDRSAELLEDFKAELIALEGRLQTVQIDPAPLLANVQNELIPAVQEKIGILKSELLGHLGYAKKSVKALAEGAVELVGEKAVHEAGFEHEWEVKLAQLGMDDPWLKEHKTVALGLELIKEALRGGRDVQIGVPVPSGAKKIGPPKGFG